MTESEGTFALLYDFNDCYQDHYHVFQEVFIPSAQIIFRGTATGWIAMRGNEPRRQLTGPLRPAEIPLNAKVTRLPDNFVRALVVYVEATESVEAKWKQMADSIK